MTEPERVDTKHWRVPRERRSSSERASILNYAPASLSHHSLPPSALPPPVGLELIEPPENEVFTPSYVPSPTPTLENYLGWQRTSFSARDAGELSEPLWNQMQYRSTLSRSLAGEVDLILDNHGSQLDPPEGFGNDPTWSPKFRGDRAKKDHYATLGDDRKCTCGQRMRLGGSRLNSLHTSRNSLDDILHPRLQAEDLARHATPVHAYGTISRSYRRHNYDKPRIDHALLDYNAQERMYSDPVRGRIHDDPLRHQFAPFQERDVYTTPSHSSSIPQSHRERLRQLPAAEISRAPTPRSDTFSAAKAAATRTPCPCLLAAMSVVRQDDAKNPSVYAHVEGCPHCGGTHTTKISSEWPANLQNPPAQSASELVTYKPQLSSSNSSSGSEVGGSQTLRSENVASSKQSLLPTQRRIETSSVYSSLPRSRMTSLSTVPLSDTESRADPQPVNVQSSQTRELPRPAVPAVSVRKPLDEFQSSRSVGDLIANAASEAKKAIGKKSSMFLGVEKTTENDQYNKWEERRRRYAERKGKLKEAETGHTTISPGDTVDGSELPDGLPLIPDDYRKDSVAALTWNGLVKLTKAVKSGFRKEDHAQVVTSGRSSRSVQQVSLQDLKDHRTSAASSREVYFDKPPTPPLQKSEDRVGGPSLDEAEETKKLVGTDTAQPSFRTKRDEVDSRTRRSRGRWGVVLDRVVDNSNRRQYGVGVVGRWFGGRSIRGSVKHQESVRHQLEAFEDYRPYFTYWVTTVQVVVLVTAIILYGFAPFGIGIRQRTGKVMVKSLSLETVDYYEPQNLWLGPRVAALVHLGAKFAPCMKSDTRIKQRLLDAREQEKSTACCIRNDNSGCIQATRSECSKWTSVKTGPGGRISGSVCGQDPSFCREPASIAPYEWPEDITKWPKCRKRLSSAVTSLMEIRKDNVNHMNCELIGRPCCIGILGECRILTREHCMFLNGRFHSDATLCSQVDCMGDVCGMIPFLNPDYPDQFYRVFISLFIHAGILHLLLTLAFQFVIMRDLERLSGPLRVGLIYFGSGIAGNLASAIFIPYRAEVGPAGSQFGILAAHLVEVIHAWHLYKRPWMAIRLPLLTILALFLIGLVPMIDNYAHFFGFLSGFLLSFSLLPFISIGDYDRKIKVSLIVVSILLYLGLLTLLIIGFYIWPIENDTVLKFFGYFNCVPITEDFCAEQNIHWTPKLFIL